MAHLWYSKMSSRTSFTKERCLFLLNICNPKSQAPYLFWVSKQSQDFIRRKMTYYNVFTGTGLGPSWGIRVNRLWRQKIAKVQKPDSKRPCGAANAWVTAIRKHKHIVIAKTPMKTKTFSVRPSAVPVWVRGQWSLSSFSLSHWCLASSLKFLQNYFNSNHT